MNHFTRSTRIMLTGIRPCWYIDIGSATRAMTGLPVIPKSGGLFNWFMHKSVGVSKNHL